MQLIQLKKDKLHVSHRSEILELRQLVLELQQQVRTLRSERYQELPSRKLDHKLKVLCEDGPKLIDFGDIVYCEASGNYTHIVTAAHSYLMSKSLKNVQALLDSTFVRCHNSFLINKNYVTSYAKGGSTLVLSDGQTIPISRRQKSLVREALL